MYTWKFWMRSPDGLLWQSSNDGTPPAGGTPPPLSGTPPPAGGTPTPPSSGTPPPAGGTPPPTPSSQFTYPEDRSRWVDPDKHRKAEQAVNRTASELAKAKADLVERDRRIAALAGVTPTSPEDAEAQRVAEAFYALPQFSHLKGITPELLGQMKALIADGASIVQARDHVYNQQADRFLGSLDVAFAETIGLDKLTPGQQRKLHAAFGAFMPDARTDPDAYGAFQKRYDSGDETLIEEFLKEYTDDMLEPARRQAAVPLAVRPRVPRGGPGAPVVTAKPKPDYSKMTTQQMLDAAEDEAKAVGR